jgi:hypothetical protein
MTAHNALITVMVVHTVAWAVFAGCIFAVPVLALAGRLGWSMLLSLVVLLECIVLAANRFKCPLTDVAARYTDDRADNFDIYLPVWLARKNKLTFGTLYAVGLLVLLGCWLR